MKFAIRWDPAALVVFYRLPIHSATLVDRAVIGFAETGQGQVEWEPPYHHLRAGIQDVLLAIDRRSRTLTVLRIYRAR